MDSIITQVTKESVVGGVGGPGPAGGENSYHLNTQLQHHHRNNQDNGNGGGGGGGGGSEGECGGGQSSNKQNSLLRQRRIVSDKSSTSSSCSNNKGNDGGGGGRGGGGGSSGDRDGGRRGETPQQQQQNGGSSNSAINFLRKLLNSCCCCVRKQQGSGGRGKEDSGGKNSGGNQQQQGSQGAWGEGEMFVGGGEVRSVGGSSSSSGGGTDEADSVVGGGAASSVGIGSGSSSGVCSGERGGISGYLLPPCLPQDRSRPCMVIDLDETLVHSSFKPISNADFIVPVEIDGVVHQVYVAKRPYVDEFLQKMGELYECVLFTASLAKYADPVADLLDKWGVFRTRLFRDACVFHRGNYVKDLNKLGRSLHRVVIVDNSPASYIFHPDNAVPVASWFDDTSDTELLYLIPFFERLSSVDNVYTVLRNSNHPYNSINKDPNQQSNLSPPQSPLHHLHHQQQPPPPPPPNYNSIIHNLQQPPPQQSPSVSSSSNQSIHQYNGAQSEDNTEIILSKSQQFSNRNSNES